jgi:hypothetical protein
MENYASNYASQEPDAQDESVPALHLIWGVSPSLPAVAQEGHVTTTWMTFAMPAPEIVEADFEEPRTVAMLAQEQRAFLATLPDDLEDVDLPLDN